MHKKAAIAVGIVLAITPLIASAQSTSVQAQIQALLAQISQLQALIAQLKGSTSSGNCVDLSSQMTIGSTDATTGGEVTKLQTFLQNNGYFTYSGSKGYYGLITANAVGKYQVDRGIVASTDSNDAGFIGPQTREALACSNSSPNGAMTSTPLDVHSDVNGNSAWVTATIAGRSFNSGVSYWSLNIGCTSGVTYSTAKVGTNDICGTTQKYYTSNMAAPTQDYYALGGTATNSASGSGNITFSLSAYDASGNHIGGDKEIAAIPGTAQSSASASIDQSSLSASTNGKDAAAVTVSGSATSVSRLQVSLDGADGGNHVATISVVNGSWSVTFPSVFPGAHSVTVIDVDTGPSFDHTLTTGTLTVTSASGNTPSITLTSPGRIANQQITIGGGYSIAWDASGMPSGTFLEFYLVALDGTTYMIPQGAMAQPAQPSYYWSVKGPVCPSNAGAPGAGGCTLALNPGTYELVVKAFTTIVNNQPSGLVAQDSSPWLSLVGSPSGVLPQPVINSFTASPSSIAAGQSSTLSWSASGVDTAGSGGGCFVTANNQQIARSGFDSSGAGAGSGSVMVSPSSATTYTLTCDSSGKDGSPSALKQVTVNVQSVPDPVINAFYASPTTVTVDTAAKLYWKASNTAQCGISVISGSAPGLDLTKAEQTFDGYTTVFTGALTQNVTYELRCAPLTGATGGYAVSDVNVTVVPAPKGVALCPADSTAQRNSMGQEFQCLCPAGFSLGPVWGGANGYYTDNSDICSAAMQAGQTTSSWGGLIDYTIKAGQSVYAGETQNGVTSQSYGSWPGSFMITGPKG